MSAMLADRVQSAADLCRAGKVGPHRRCAATVASTALRIIGNARASLDPGLGQDTLLGGAAGDTIFIRDGETDPMGCGGGTDTSNHVD